MKSFKKLTSLVIALTMIVSMFSGIVMAADIEFSDVTSEHQYYTAIYNLVSKGVLNGYEDGTFKPDNTITRAEFAKVIMVSELGESSISASAVANFTDTNGHWANKYIAAAVNAGIINGYPDKTFKPDNTVTYAEAVKMVVCALGYGPVIDTTLDPWYTGYIKQATTLGATKGAIAVADEGASRGIVAQLIDNMDDCKRLVQTGTDSNGNPIYSQSNSNVEWDDDEYSDGYGVLVGVYENSLIGSESTLTKSQIQIDGAVYTLDDGVDYTSIERFIGYSIDYKIRKTSGNRLYVSNITSNNSTKIVELDAYDIDYYSNGDLYYFEDDSHEDTAKYKIDSNLYVVYNGYGVPSASVTSSFIKDLFDMDAGSVKLYNNDSDAAYDVAIVEKYDTYFVNTVSKDTTNGTVTITDKLGYQPKLVLDEDSVEVTKISTSGDESTGVITDIASKNVVSVATPHSSAPSDALVKVVISKWYVSGSVDSMVGDYETITVKSKNYVLANCFSDFLKVGDNESTYGFDVGSTVKFFLDFTGKIVCTDVTETSASYGYLIDYLQSGGVNSTSEIRILTTGSKLVTYPLAKDVTINGTSYSVSEALTQLKASNAVINADKDADYKAPSGSIEQLITYELGTQDSTTVVKKIGTVGTGTDGDVVPYAFTHNSSVAKSIFTDCASSSEKTPYAKSTSTFKSQDGKTQFTLNSSTIVFYVPYGRTDIDDYKKYTKSNFLDSSYFVEPYDIDGVTADVVVWYGDDGDDEADITAASPTVIVNSINRTLDSSNNTVYTLEYTTLGSTSTSTATAETSSVLSGIDTGDIIKIALSGTELDKVALVYDVSADKLYSQAGSVESDNYTVESYNGDSLYYQANAGIVYGIPESGDGTIAILEDGSTDDYRTYTVNSSTKYYKLVTTGSTTVVSSDYSAESVIQYQDDPASATKVVVVAYDTYVKGILILE